MLVCKRADAIEMDAIAVFGVVRASVAFFTASMHLDARDLYACKGSHPRISSYTDD